MKQNKHKGAVLKGLAFPIGYTVYMNVFQIGAVLLIAGLCLARALLALIAVPDIGIDAYVEHYMLDYANLINSNTWFLSALTTISALLILWFVFNRKGKSFIEYFRFTPAPAKAIIAAALLGLSGYFITNALMTVLQQALFALIDWLLLELESAGFDITPFVEYIEMLLESMSQMYDGVGMFTIAAILGAPLIEELVFRAGPLVNLTKKMPAFAAIMLTSALFALAHGSPLQMIYTFGLGVVAGYLFIKSDSIYPAIVCHFAFNGANLIALAMESLFRTDFWIDSPHYEEICAKLDTWSVITFWIYTAVTFVIAIPVLVIGIIMLIKLRRPEPAVQDVEPIVLADGVCVIAAEPSLGEQRCEQNCEQNCEQSCEQDCAQDSEQNCLQDEQPDQTEVSAPEAECEADCKADCETDCEAKCETDCEAES